MAMNPKVKKKWVKALRSGKYKQGKGRLRSKTPKGETTFCCLGVLCNLHAKAHPKIAAGQRDARTYLGSPFDLPMEVAAWAGFPRASERRILVNGRREGLAWANDHGDLNFSQLADLIEAQL